MNRRWLFRWICCCFGLRFLPWAYLFCGCAWIIRSWRGGRWCGGNGRSPAGDVALFDALDTLHGTAAYFGNSLLVRNSEFGTAVAVGAWAAYLSLNDQRAYDLAPVLCLLVLSAAIAVLAVRTLYTTLDWVWQMNEQSKSPAGHNPQPASRTAFHGQIAAHCQRHPRANRI